MKILLPTLKATQEWAQRLAPHVKAGDLLALSGDLGAGKTEFARALIHALGVAGDVPSPTFTLLQTYDADFPIAHFDLYRLKNADELDELGWDDALADGLVIAEWPERAGGRLPRDYLALHFAMDGDARHCVPTGHGKWAERLKGVVP